MQNFARRTLKKALSFAKPRVVFALVLAAALGVSVKLFADSINTYIIYYSGKSATVKTVKKDAGAALCFAGIDGEVYRIASESETQDNTYALSLIKTFTVPVTSGDKTVEVLACETDTVGQVLTLAGYTVDKFDMIEPAVDTVVSEDTYIDYVNIDYVTGSYTQAIPYHVTTIYSQTLDTGKKITTKGKDGLEQINYTRKLVNGEIVSTSVDSKVTLLAAEDAIQTVGIRRPAVTTSAGLTTISELTPATPIALDANGNPVNYKKHVTVQATAYTYTGHNCSTGVAPRPGYIAVNPKIIPYGTKMYIKSSDGRYIYGYAIAADTGGFIYSRPTNVDLFFPTVSSMNTFGRRNVEIYILE